jgi:hypothetical protein
MDCRAHTGPLGGVHFVNPQDGFFADRPSHMFTCADVGEARLFMPCVDTFGIDAAADLDDPGRSSHHGMVTSCCHDVISLLLLLPLLCLFG